MSYFLVSTNNGKMNIKPVATYPLNTDSSLLLYYTFETTNGLSLLNNKTGLYDASLSNTAIVTTANKKNGSQSGYFNGTGYYVTLPSTLTIGTNGFTIACWINITALPFSNCVIWQLGDGNGSGSPAWNGNISFGIYSNNVIQVGSFKHGINCSYSSGFSTGSWYHIVFTFNSSFQCLLYVNGSQVQSSNGSEYTFVNSPVSYCYLGNGTYNGGFGNPSYNGYLDDFRIYNRVLSAAEIASLYTYK